MSIFRAIPDWVKRVSAGSLLLALTSGLALCPEALSASKEALFYVLEAEALGGYSSITGHQGTFSSIDNWLVSPTLKLNDGLYWINIYNGSYNRSAQVVAQEEGGREANTTQQHSLSSSFKFKINESWSLRPLFFTDWIFVNQTNDEDFGDGLYDYRDIGGGIESSWTTLDTKDRKDELRLGFRYLNREYPNYQSLLSLFDPNGAIETNEKDLNGYKINLGHDSRSRNDWSWGLEGIFFYKDYTDKKTINSNGIRSTGDTREDIVEYLNAHLSHPLGKEWGFRLDGQFAANQSDLDFYDTHNTLALGDDNFLKDYFDTVSFLARPALTYTRNIKKDMDFVLSANYSFYALLYPGRKAQNVSGVYQTDDQRDFTHTFSVKASYPITDHLSWVALGSYTIADSNQKFENFYLYSYDLWSAVTGISLKF